MRWMKRAVPWSAAAAVGAAVAYGLTLSPTVGAGDSGELILAADTFGIPHPPGYPVWLLLARAIALLPLGSVALRVNALSALLAAVAAGLLVLFAARCGLGRGAQAAAAALFAGSTIAWGSAVRAEVYALASASFLLLALAALEARRGRGDLRRDALFFFLAGLAPLVHQTLIFPAAALALWVLAREPRAGRMLRAAMWSAVGFSIVLVLPIRSAAHPALDWGRDRNLLSLWDNLLRRNYGGLSQNSFRPERAFQEIGALGSAFAGSVGLVLVLLLPFGLRFGGRRRLLLVPLTLAALTIPLALVALLSFTPDPEHVAQVLPFLAPLAAAGALWAGAGAKAAVGLAPRAWRRPLGTAIAGGVLLTLALHYTACDRTAFRLPELYGRELLEPLPHGATLIVEGDNETFLAAYLSRVEGLRPDVTLLNRRGYVFGDPYGLRGLERSRWTEVQDRIDLERLRSATRPVYYTTPPVGLARSGVLFLSEGLVYRAELPNAASHEPGEVPAWPRSTELLPGGPERYDYLERKLAITYSAVRAQELWEAGRYDEAYPWFADAARVGFDFAPARMNLSVAAAATGRADVALSELLAAKKLAPGDPEPSARLGLYFAAAGRYREAALYFERAYWIRPSEELKANAAKAWELAGDHERAARWEARRG